MLRFFITKLFTILALAALLSGCASTPQVETPAPVPDETQIPTATLLPSTPTNTPEPMALTVNSEGIPLTEYQASLSQMQQARPELSAEEQGKRVIDQLLEETLLAQAARAANFQVDDAALQAREQELIGKIGGEAALLDWQTRNGYTPQSFRSVLRRAAEAAWQRDQILAAVPQSADQVHARQILVLTEAAAQLVKQRLSQAGANFATLAFGYDLSTGGDLGWFPRGYLTQPAVEDAAFALQPGEVSEIIQTEYGYHILQVVAREERPLTEDALQALQRKALVDWLAQRRSDSQVDVLVP